MKIRQLSKWTILITAALAVLCLTECVPPSDAGETVVVNREQARRDSILNRQCELYLSFAYSYYQNQDWKGAIDNYKKMVDAGCGKNFAKDIYIYYGRCYQQLGSRNPAYYDSALFIYQKGEQFLPNDIYLRRNIAYIYQVQGKKDLEIREWEKILDLTPDDLEVLRRLVKLCYEAGRYEDELHYIDGILAINPNDENAINDRLIAYNKLGKDITEIKKDLWQKNPSSARYGLEYAVDLKQKQRYAEAIDVYKQVVVIDPKNRIAREDLALLLYNLGNITEALQQYIYLAQNILINNPDILQKITDGYLSQSNFEEAIAWAEKAASAGTAQGHKIRAMVYYIGADRCAAGKPNFEDKLVYKLAYDDYLKAYQMGDITVKERLDHLKEYLIPTKGDWFMNAQDASGNPRSNYRPVKPCYKWVKTEPKKD